jgi:hypothetical protein
LLGALILALYLRFISSGIRSVLCPSAATTARSPFALRGLMSELAERGLQVSYRAVWCFVHTEKLSYKKTVHAAEQDCPDVARRWRLWQKYQGMIDPSRLVFIDETWTKTNMAPLRGWSPIGTRLAVTERWRFWKSGFAWR